MSSQTLRGAEGNSIVTMKGMKRVKGKGTITSYLSPVRFAHSRRRGTEDTRISGVREGQGNVDAVVPASALLNGFLWE